MDNIDNKNELFERISNDYYMLLLNWAYKKTGNRAEAEDLTQEVFAQVFRSAQKERHIEKLDNFIWKIAHFVWCNYLKKSSVLQSCVSIDNFDKFGRDFLSEKDYAEKYAEEEELNDRIKKMRLKISNLNYLQREIMIMRYIDELPLKSISKKLNITEANVKWHLYDTRKKLKKEIIEMDNTDFVYRPGKFHMAISGNPGPAPDTNKINENLVKQNICLACYRAAKTSGELAEMLGVAQAYIEFDLKWLVERQFMKNENGRYSTMFSITSGGFYAKTANIFLKSKESFADVIIGKFIARQDKIKDIGFYGSEQPIEKLLWLLIYRFVAFIDDKVTYGENKYPQPERPIMPDGGRYFPLGFDQSENNNKTIENPILSNEKYKGIANWDSNGAMHAEYDGDRFFWMGLYKAGNHSIQKLHNMNNHKIINVFRKALKKDFNIDNLNGDEKTILSEIISCGWVTKKDDKIIHNFSIFTSEQNKTLENIFGEIYVEIKPEVYKIYDEIEKICREDLPAHLDFYINYHIYMTFYRAIKIITGFAYYDGKLYVPKDDAECGLLTFQAII